MSKLVIDRKRWIRGDDPGESCLLRDDKKMCCLGFYLCSLGVRPSKILDMTSPCAVEAWRDATASESDIPQDGQWLLTEAGRNSPSCRSLMGTNDRDGITEATREKRIAATFAKHGVTVHFVDGAKS